MELDRHVGVAGIVAAALALTLLPLTAPAEGGFEPAPSTPQAGQPARRAKSMPTAGSSCRGS